VTKGEDASVPIVGPTESKGDGAQIAETGIGFDFQILIPYFHPQKDENGDHRD